MRNDPRHVAAASVLTLLLARCASPLPFLQAPVYVGIDTMASAEARTRLLADLAAVPWLRVVDLAVARNAWAFDALPANKLRLSVRLDRGEMCADAWYSVWAGARFAYSSGLAVPRVATDGGAESCLALLASRLAERLSAAEAAERAPSSSRPTAPAVAIPRRSRSPASV